MATSGRHCNATTLMTAVLLALQVLAGVAVPLAHAGEIETARAGIEAHHDTSCVVIHDAMRCALCLYFNSLNPPPPATRVGARPSTPTRSAPLAAAPGIGSQTSGASQPRAPPIHLS